MTRYLTIVGTEPTSLIIGPCLTKQEILDLARQTAGVQTVTTFIDALLLLNRGDRIFMPFNPANYETEFLIYARHCGLEAEARNVVEGLRNG